MAVGKRTERSSKRIELSRSPRREDRAVLPAPGGGWIVHGPAKPADPSIAEGLEPAVERARRTADDLRDYLAERTS